VAAETSSPRSPRRDEAKIPGALKRYQVMAYVVGVMLLVLVVIAIPLRYGFGIPEVSMVVSPIHGFLFIVYLVAAFDLALRARFTAKGTLLVLLAGVVPLLSFWAERRVTARVRAGQPI